MELLTNPEKFMKIIQAICHCREFIFRNSLKFSFWGPHTCTTGVKFGMEVSTLDTKFHPHHCGMKYVKIA